MVSAIIPIFREFGGENRPDSHLREVMILRKVLHSENGIFPGDVPRACRSPPVARWFFQLTYPGKFNCSALISCKI
jgi:hypothetical protein